MREELALPIREEDLDGTIQKTLFANEE